VDASPSNSTRHRLPRGNRRINPTLHIMATVQLHNRTEGRARRDAFDVGKLAGRGEVEDEQNGGES
jgi:transposase